MRAVLAILVVCLIGKDLAFVPFPDVLRGCAQSLCLIFGTIAVLPALSSNLVLRYWPMLVYLVVLLLAAPFTQFPSFVILQIGSLMSAIVFAIGYFENQSEAAEMKLRWLVLWIVLVYGVVSAASLILIKLNPGQAYESIFFGGTEGYELRFRGLFSKSAQMGAAGGLLAGLAMIRVKSLPLKLLLGLLGLICLVLPQCRSFWVAAFIAGGVTAWFYYRSLRNWIIASCGVIAVLLVAFGAFDVTLNTSGLSAFARVNTISTLTGRTALWQAAFKGWSERPLLGYGFTIGALGLNGAEFGGGGVQGGQSFRPTSNPAEISRTTLHNGYIQSLLDSGLAGFVSYVMTILIAISCVFRYDHERKFPEVLYVLLFLSISNGGESVVYSGSVFHSLCFWIFAAFAMGLKGLKAFPAKAEVTSPNPASVTIRFSNLMR